MNAILAMALKDIRLLTRDRVGLFFIIGFPFVYALFIGSIFSTGSSGGGGGFRVAVTDEDNTEASRDFIAKLGEKGSVKVAPSTREEAAAQVRLGQAQAYLVIPAGFGAAHANPFLSRSPAVELGTDPAHIAEGAMLEGMLMQLGFASMGDLMSKPEARAAMVKSGVDALNNTANNPQQASESTQKFLKALTDLDQLTKSANGDGATSASALFQPLTIEKKSVATGPRRGRGPSNSFEFSFPQGIAWALLFCVTRFGSSLVGERVRGTLVRMQVAPLTRWQIIGGKALACILVMALVGGALTVFASIVLHVHVRSIPLFAVAAASSIICFTGLMALISTLGKTEEAAAGIGTAVMLVITMTGGGAVPLLAMPPWMQQLASVSPVKWAILSLEGAIWRGFTPLEMLTPCLILLATGAICFTIGIRAFRWHAA